MTFKTYLVFILATTFATPCLTAQEPDTKAPEQAGTKVIDKGVEPGAFTQDHAAAMKYAKEKKLPVMLNFTGSDWCGWCKIMDKNVFSKPEWTAYAKESLVMIYLDFPKDKSKVPVRYQERNEKLKGAFGVRGYPTYVLLDWDGRSLGKLGSGRDKTPASFKAEVETVLKKTSANIYKLCEGYKPDDAALIKASLDALRAAQSSKNQTMATVSELRNKANDLQKEANETFSAAEQAFQEALEKGKVNAMDDETKAKYTAAKEAFDKAETALQDWLKINARKPRTPERFSQYKELSKAVQDAKKAIDAF